MLSYNLDLEERSTWLRATPGEAELAQPFYCTEQGCFYAHEGFYTRRSCKESYELFYTFDGCGTFEQGERSTLLEKGSALLMDCRFPQAYGTAPGSGRWYHLWAHVDGAGVDELARLLEVGSLRPVRLPEAVVRKDMATIASNLEITSVLSSTVIGLAIHSLLAEMVGAATAASQATESDAAVRRACALIEGAYGQDLTLDDIAESAAVSKSYLLRLFKRHLGTTPYEYLMRYRITRAKELLAETDLRVGQIARSVGFNSESNFSYRFSRMVGQSPREYRASCPTVSRGDGQEVARPS